MEPFEKAWAGTELGVVLEELKIVGTIWCHETDFKKIGGIRISELSDQSRDFAEAEDVGSEFWPEASGIWFLFDTGVFVATEFEWDF